MSKSNVLQRTRELDNKYFSRLGNTMESSWPVVFKKAEGARIWDYDGKEYLDFHTGVTTIGHCHAKVVKALTKQISTLMHTNVGYNDVRALLGEKLCKLAGYDKTHIVSGGGEDANESAIKLMRRHFKNKRSKRYEIIVMENCYHGRTLTTLGATGFLKNEHTELEPLTPGFGFASFNDLKSVESLVTDKTAAVMTETIQGSSGMILASKDFLKGVAQLCDREGLLFIIDEVQTGMGRTGKFFGHQHYDVRPDIVTMAKGLGGGFPMGAMLTTKEVAAVMIDESTFAGNHLACTAALAALEALVEGNMVENAAKMGDYMMRELGKLKDQVGDAIAEVRGLGLYIGLELAYPSGETQRRLLENGLITLGTSGNNRVLRLLPPLTITKQDVDEAVGIIELTLRAGR